MNKKQNFIKAFREATLNHTCKAWVWDSKVSHSVLAPYPHPIPAGKYTIDENFGKNEICIRCRKCWTDDLIIVAEKVAPKFKAKVSGHLGVSDFGMAYNFFVIRFR